MVQMSEMLFFPSRRCTCEEFFPLEIVLIITQYRCNALIEEGKHLRMVYHKKPEQSGTYLEIIERSVKVRNIQKPLENWKASAGKISGKQMGEAL